MRKEKRKDPKFWASGTLVINDVVFEVAGMDLHGSRIHVVTRPKALPFPWQVGRCHVQLLGYDGLVIADCAVQMPPLEEGLDDGDFITIDQPFTLSFFGDESWTGAAVEQEANR